MTGSDKQDGFSRLWNEVSSSDLPFRQILYNRMTQLLTDIEAGESSDLMKWVTDDVTMITFLNVQGGIFQGKNELSNYFDNDYHDVFRTLEFRAEVPTLIIVDRGRITCHLERFYMEDAVLKSIKRQHVLAIFDLDGANRIKRIEYRLLLDSLDTTGCTLEEIIADAKERVVDVDHTASFASL